MGLSRINQVTFQKVLLDSTDSFLLCFHHSGNLDESLLATIEESSKHYSTLQTYLVCEDDWPFFQDKFGFWGAPLHIILRDGVEKERLLGKVSGETMTKFIHRNVGKG